MGRPLGTRAHILGARCGLSKLGAHRPSFWFVLGCPGAGATRWSKHIPIPPPPRPRRGASRLRLAASPSPLPTTTAAAGAGAARVWRMRAGDHRPVSCALARALQARTAFLLVRRGAGGIWRKAAPPGHHSPRDPGYGWFVRTGGRPRPERRGSRAGGAPAVAFRSGLW